MNPTHQPPFAAAALLGLLALAPTAMAVAVVA